MAPPREWAKRYFALRHGRSEANEARVVASRIENAGTAFGLTARGRAEVERSVRAGRGLLCGDGGAVGLVASPFLRTRQSAEIAAGLLGVEVREDARLAERDFGAFELMGDENYQQVWDADPGDGEASPGGAEPVASVARRVAGLVDDLEADPDARTWVLVTHCDVAMVLACVLRGIDPRRHRSLDPLGTGELRRLA